MSNEAPLVPDGNSHIDEQPDDEQSRGGQPFPPGVSGNPRGRPKGSRNKSTLMMAALLEGDAEAIINKLIEKAKSGDVTALRICAERLLPLRRDRPVELDLPPITTTADAIADRKQSSRHVQMARCRPQKPCRSPSCLLGTFGPLRQRTLRRD